MQMPKCQDQFFHSSYTCLEQIGKKQTIPDKIDISNLSMDVKCMCDQEHSCWNHCVTLFSSICNFVESCVIFMLLNPCTALSVAIMDSLFFLYFLLEII